MNPIQNQAVELWQNISDKDTALTLKKGLQKFWELLQQTLQLCFFIVLLGVALIIWFWSIGYQSGRYFRNWTENDVKSPDDLVTQLINMLLKPLQVLPDWAKTQIQELLGIELKALPSAKTQNILPATKDTSLAVDVKKEVLENETSSLRK
ncbi:hypothetical protein H6G41_15375 [Tolypothrix sp. FACHB-123]|uniref:Rab5-interacting family protein n=1 Tax=Tolypothrix sp. FACHB-123 TaxID=2692868 RepID=UPI00168997DF|nr:Rab5-interacting family protein [Tolypothrix sp. FACHB-123]MBD2355986.1 hypothetical protein [Tolypothrix sp. FACHB-123]